MIDADGSGTLHVTELVQGLLKIRGELTKSDSSCRPGKCGVFPRWGAGDWGQKMTKGKRLLIFQKRTGSMKVLSETMEA